ncbi:hypothetical protein FOL47_004005 [Perkinsus chesapeaki]|uniref:Uncharacterized protein n=1 Tax=Perkinsus chesapeaki TaxID=330153 RepID=A0A7J6M5B1_PERCH|nr:hypothetical protein FOL47_004005 [Perkinsus chesapeaki]
MLSIDLSNEEEFNERLTRMIASNRDDCAGMDNHRDPFLIERYITRAVAKELLECASREEAEQLIVTETKLIDPTVSGDASSENNDSRTMAATLASSAAPKEGTQEHQRLICVVDLFLMFARFCQQKDFTEVKASTLLSIIRETYSQAMLHRMDVSTAFFLFRRLILKHSVQRPPVSIRVFTLEEVKAITCFAANTFFSHYKLYIYINMPHRQLVANGIVARTEQCSLTHEEVLKQQECYNFSDETRKSQEEKKLPKRMKDAIES